MNDYTYYIILLVAIIAAVLVIKNVTRCLIRVITTIVFLAILVWCLKSIGLF